VNHDTPAIRVSGGIVGNPLVRLGGEFGLNHVINVAAVVDNRILVDSLRVWASEITDIQLAAVTPTRR
jgi:hypothetical protein